MNFRSSQQKQDGNPLKPVSTILLILLFALVFLFIVLKSCRGKPLEPPSPLEPGTFLTDTTIREDTADTLSEDTVEKKDTLAPAPVPQKPAEVDSPGDTTLEMYRLIMHDSVIVESESADSLFVYADPWGGRHFDSVTVELFCREGCLIIYSLEDSLNMKSYSDPIKILRNQTLWIAGVNDSGQQSSPVQIKYVIEKRRGDCPENMMPFESQGSMVCMDVYEWPNKDGERPSAYVTRREAADSCAAAGKRLCTLEEWQIACRGPERNLYPYGNKYNENYCPAKEKTARRSGRFPVCRSYFGFYDLTGNLWEWTSTQYTEREEYYMVAGGNWTTGNQATCRQTKFSFFPQNRYLFVGFRCCQDVPGK
jgi:hypothetical protein